MVGNATSYADVLPTRGWFLRILLIRVWSMDFIGGSNINQELDVSYKHNTRYYKNLLKLQSKIWVSSME